MHIIIEILNSDNFIVDYLFPVLGIIVPSVILFATVWYTNKKNKELLMEDKSPLVVMANFNNTKETNFMNTHKFYVDSIDLLSDTKKNKIKKALRYLELKNVGESSALNVRFFNLYNGKKIEGNLVSNNTVDLASFPTIVIQKDSIEKFSMIFRYVLLEAKSDIDVPLYMGNEFLMLIVYNDVFNNKKDLIFYLLYNPNKRIFEYSILLDTDERYSYYKNKYNENYNLIYEELNKSLNKIEKEKK